MTTVSETLHKAADLIEKRGWRTGSWQPDGDGPLCVEGAIAAAMGITDKVDAIVSCPAKQAVREYLGVAPFIWNDRLKHQHTAAFIAAGDYIHYESRAIAVGQAEVIEVLRAAAVIEESREAALVEVSA